MTASKAERDSIIIGLSATHSLREIESTLDSQGIKLSRTTIGKIIAGNRKERSEQTKEVVNEHIKHTLTTDLDILQNMRDEIYQMFLNEDKILRPSERLMCADRVNKVIDTRLRYSGAAEPTRDDDLSKLTDEELRAIVDG